MKIFSTKSKRPAATTTQRRTAPSTMSIGPHTASHRAQIRQILHGPLIQPKLTMGQPKDKYEQEADRIAEKIVNMPETDEFKNNSPLKITPKTKKLPRGETKVPPQFEMTINSMMGKGRSLPETTLGFFGSHFGDLSQVNVHTDGKAERSAKELNARAFTVGNDIMFGSGQYSPESRTGKKLLAHELTHVVQQDARQHIGNPEVMCRSYGYKEFSFDMQEDGRIIVKKGDWLSKYTAAMHDGDTSRERVDEFVRLSKNYEALVEIRSRNELKKEIVLIENKDLIKEGENIYHISTLIKYISRKKPAGKTPKPLILFPENIPVEKDKGPREGLRPPEPRPFEKPEKWEQPYEGPSILHGEPEIESAGERYQREQEEKEERSGGSADLPGTRKGEVDLLKVEEYLKKYWPF